MVAKTNKYQGVPRQKQNKISAKLNEFYCSTEKVKVMSRERRDCILVDENLNQTDIKMDAFHEYTKASCLLECRQKLKKLLFI